MVRLLAPSLLCLALAASAVAQEEGHDRMERGAQEFLEGLLEEMAPAWEEMRSFMEAMGPAMQALLEEVKDWSAYDPPEVLENGDIIIRRKPDVPDPDAPETAPSATEQQPSIEL